MADYVKVFNQHRTIMIRDTGVDVEFWINFSSIFAGQEGAFLYGGQPISKPSDLYQAIPPPLYQSDGYVKYTVQPGGGWQRLAIVFNQHRSHDALFLVYFPNSQYDGYSESTFLQQRILRGVGPDGIVQSAVRVKVGEEHKIAIVYINVNGTWMPAEPWAKHEGVWRLGQ